MAAVLGAGVLPTGLSRRIALAPVRVAAPLAPVAARPQNTAQAQVLVASSISLAVTTSMHVTEGRAARLACQAAAQEATLANGDAAGSAAAVEQPSFICTSVTASTVEAFLAEIQEAAASGVDIIELRLDFIKDFDTERDLERLMKECPLPFIVTYRPVWEGGNYDGPEAERLATLKFAALRGAPYVDVELKAAQYFFADQYEVPLNTKVILSYHDFKQTPSLEVLRKIIDSMWNSGADIVKIATMANNITDAASMLALLQEKKGPTISLSMGERGGLTRLLAAKYGGYLTFAAMSPERASAPGQPDIQLLRKLYNFGGQKASTKLFGIIGNPVSHSRSPLIHNTAFQHIGFDGVYVPLLVDDLAAFLKAYAGHDFHGFSVTIPHKEAALQASSEVDPVAAQIGAVNTLIRQPDGTFKGYNTDWVAAISAIERCLAGGQLTPGAPSPLNGKTVVVLGAGGAGRALAFGAASRGAKVVITNRNYERAQQLAAAMGASASAVPWEDVASGRVSGHVLANSTSVGMAPKDSESPVPADVLGKYECVFDAVYTPLWTRLLLDAKAAGAKTVDGLQMFVGQALDQFRHFTGQEPPEELMTQTLLDAINKKK